MTIYPLLIEATPTYLRFGREYRTLLLTPVGTRLLVQVWAERLREFTRETPTVLCSAPTAAAALNRTSIQTGAAVVIASIDELLDRVEPSDRLLLIDPRYFPGENSGFRELAENLSADCEVRHLVAMDQNDQGLREFVQFDAKSRVRRVQRFYDGVTWLQTRAVMATLLPVSAAREMPSQTFATLDQLRQNLVSQGIVSRDVVLRAPVFDLNRETDLVRLFENRLRFRILQPPPEGFAVLQQGVWIGACCRIDPTARLYGPIIVHAGAEVGPGATLIGPVLIGADARIGNGCVLAECLVLPGAEMPPGTTARFQVYQSPASENVIPLTDGLHDPLPNKAAERLRIVWTDSADAEEEKKRDRYLLLKRVIDTTVAAVGLLLLSPLLLLTGLIVKLTSRGPVFFCHEREGMDGRPFPCRKFRTMVADAHEQQRKLYQTNNVDGPQFKMKSDPRITPVGHVLRKTNLDELPQLFNVLLGQMSLIGPRPSPFRENQICVPWREARLAVRPGITGLWQICRHERDTGDFHQWIQYDMLYVRHMSFLLDLKILTVTLLTLGGRWSVPVTWLIPMAKLTETAEPALGK